VAGRTSSRSALSPSTATARRRAATTTAVNLPEAVRCQPADQPLPVTARVSRSQFSSLYPVVVEACGTAVPKNRGHRQGAETADQYLVKGQALQPCNPTGRAQRRCRVERVFASRWGRVAGSTRPRTAPARHGLPALVARHWLGAGLAVPGPVVCGPQNGELAMAPFRHGLPSRLTAAHVCAAPAATRSDRSCWHHRHSPVAQDVRSAGRAVGDRRSTDRGGISAHIVRLGTSDFTRRLPPDCPTTGPPTRRAVTQLPPVRIRSIELSGGSVLEGTTSAATQSTWVRSANPSLASWSRLETRSTNRPTRGHGLGRSCGPHREG
jgi:hypothetical protein